MRYQLAKVPRHGMNGTIGVLKYCTPSSQWAPTALRPPKIAETGHSQAITKPIQAVTSARNVAIAFPAKEDRPCTRARHEKQAIPLKARSNFSSNKGRLVGESRRITTKDPFVTENATRIPADTKSSRYVNGTKVAINVMTEPANNVPLRRFPFPSISQNIWGARPSRAKAYCSRGCNMQEIRTTTGRVKTSPAFSRINANKRKIVSEVSITLCWR
mmetsp:Transcript_50663/g.93665  ORF Transcript_50663/g.93665 Transcript_50663/m.93665 type:complete len:216 (+) Transcript_50663:234-881(+)